MGNAWASARGWYGELLQIGHRDVLEVERHLDTGLWRFLRGRLLRLGLTREGHHQRQRGDRLVHWRHLGSMPYLRFSDWYGGMSFSMISRA